MKDISAFPNPHFHGEEYRGMSLRDYFAGLCLTGQIANTVDKDDCKRVATVCYAHADAMLTARESGEK